jgi:nicotinamide mononucleotide adenylyltransferase
MKNKYGYFHGRFQPFHNEHLDRIKMIADNHEMIIIGISNPLRIPPVFEEYDDDESKKSLAEARKEANNPWTYWQRLLMIRNSLIHEKIDLNRVIFLPNLVRTGLPIEEMRLPKDQCVLYLCPSAKHNKTNLDNYIKKGWQVKEIDVSQKTISATMIRQMLRDNNPEWEKYVPMGTAEIIKQYPIK